MGYPNRTPVTRTVHQSRVVSHLHNKYCTSTTTVSRRRTLTDDLGRLRRRNPFLFGTLNPPIILKGGIKTEVEGGMGSEELEKYLGLLDGGLFKPRRQV